MVSKKNKGNISKIKIIQVFFFSFLSVLNETPVCRRWQIDGIYLAHLI